MRELQEERRASGSDTIVIPTAKKGGGKLVVFPNECTPEQTFPLQEEGLYIVGRKASASNANIRIDTKDKSMSRSHIRIEVKKSAQGSLLHSLSDNHSKNHTLYNGRYLDEGEVIVLKNKDEIVIGDTRLQFCE
ncbi:MAG: FHA domain-containing protein [Tannerella sp.]|nr:FHA domain-containing protein [Tannerella sp.]